MPCACPCDGSRAGCRGKSKIGDWSTDRGTRSCPSRRITDAATRRLSAGSDILRPGEDRQSEMENSRLTTENETFAEGIEAAHRGKEMVQVSDSWFIAKLIVTWGAVGWRRGSVVRMLVFGWRVSE